MRRYELVPEPTVVWNDGGQPGNEARQDFARANANSPEELLQVVNELSPTELKMTIVALDAACSTNDDQAQSDCVIALAAVLADRGVVAIETRHTIAVGRVFETNRAIEAGTIEADH